MVRLVVDMHCVSQVCVPCNIKKLQKLLLVNNFQTKYSLNSVLYCNAVISIHLYFISIYGISDFLYFLHRLN